MHRYAYFYFMAAEPERIREAIPRHVAYWKNLDLPGYIGGPFADRSGGLIIFSAPDSATAEALVLHDPFQEAGVIEKHWLKEWLPE